MSSIPIDIWDIDENFRDIAYLETYICTAFEWNLFAVLVLVG